LLIAEKMSANRRRRILAIDRARWSILSGVTPIDDFKAGILKGVLWDGFDDHFRRMGYRRLAGGADLERGHRKFILTWVLRICRFFHTLLKSYSGRRRPV
jgi:hypothetical protein